MTQPIQEPTVPRALARSTWNENQLYRRPSQFPGPWPWVRRINLTGFTVTAGSSFTVNYDDGGDPDDLKVTGSDDWQDYFSLFSSSQTRLNVTGFFMISGQYHWDNNFPETHMCYMRDGYDWETGISFNSDSAFESPSHAFSFPHRYPGEATDPTRTIQMALQHDSASNQDIIVCYTEIWYMGGYTGPDPTFDAAGDSNFPPALEE